MGVHPFLSVGLISSTAGERLTAWMVVHRFLLEVNLIKHEKQLTCWINFYVFLSDVLLRHWRVTHFLDGHSPILVSGSDLLNWWRETHCLDGRSPIHIKGQSDQTLKSNSLAGSMFMHYC